MLASKASRFSILDLYLGVVFLFPIVTMLVDGTIFNRLLFVLLFGLHLVSFFMHPISRKTLLQILLLLVHFIYTFLITQPPYSNVNLFIYYLYFFLYTYFVCDNMEKVVEWFRKRKDYVQGVILLWSILVGVSIFIPSCYTRLDGGIYFGSFCGSIFRLGPTAMFIQVLAIAMLVLYKQKWAILYMIIPMYCVLMAQSRTYLVIGLCLFIVSLYLVCVNKQLFWGSLIPICGMFIIVMMNSAMWDKILYTLDEERYGDFWYRITSSRSLLWEQNLTAWGNTSFVKKMFGNGFDFTNDVTELWAHNDFIEILCSCGLLGLLQYMGAMRDVFKRGYGEVRIPFVVKVCVFTVWFFNAFFNMHYVYLCAMLSFPFLVFVLRCYFEESGETVRKKKRIHLRY